MSVYFQRTMPGSLIRIAYTLPLSISLKVCADHIKVYGSVKSLQQKFSSKLC